MEDQVWNKILLELKNFNVLVNLGLHCEPFMDKHIIKRLKDLISINKRILIITNGNAIPDEFYEEFRDNKNIFIRVSMLAPTQDEYETLTGLNYEKVKYSINKLKALNFNVEILYTIGTYNDPNDLKQYFKGIPFQYQFRDSRAGVFKKELIYKKQNTVGYDSYCRQLTDALHIDVNGDFIICCQDWNKESKEFNIKDIDFLTYYNELSSKRINILNNIYPLDKCKYCIEEFNFEKDMHSN